MRTLQITGLYIAFAIIATGVNLLTQEAVLGFVDGRFQLPLAIGAGTATGLVSKFFLDKRYIFADQADSKSDSLSKFMAYTVTGIATTLVFWGFEFGFDAYFGSKTARYIGAILGLTLGYGLKYQLDKHYVFSATRTLDDPR